MGYTKKKNYSIILKYSIGASGNAPNMYVPWRGKTWVSHMLLGFLRTLSYFVSPFKIIAMWSGFRSKSVMFKIFANCYRQSKLYYVMALVILKIIMFIFCSSGIKWWTVIFTVCLRLKNYSLVIPLQSFVPKASRGSTN